MFRRKLLLFSLVTAAGFGVTFLFALWVLGSPSDLETPDPGQERFRIAADAEFIRQFVFEEDVPGSSLMSRVPTELIGLTSTELAQTYPHWNIISFAPDRVVVEEVCPQLTGGFLRVENDALLIYQGTPDGCHKPTETVPIDLSRLSPLHAWELARGVSFASDDDLARILDGVMAP